MKSIDIVITAWLRGWMTEACLEAIKRNTNTPHRIILIDNGSNWEGRLKYLAATDIYVKLDRNYGLEYVKNLGMQFVESEYFVSMDNDILVYKYDPDWLGRLVGLMKKYPDYKAIGCKPQILIGTGMYMFENLEELIPFHHVPGYARIMNTEAVREVGAWNDKREGRGHEELWIGDKFQERGWKMGWAREIECAHLFGKEGEDTWGYPIGTESGHKAIWPIPTNDYAKIEERTGIKI